MDSTFSSIGIAERNFDLALKAGYQLALNYVYFDPAYAWVFAQARSRKVPLEVLKANFSRAERPLNICSRNMQANLHSMFIIGGKILK